MSLKFKIDQLHSTKGVDEFISTNYSDKLGVEVLLKVFPFITNPKVKIYFSYKLFQIFGFSIPNPKISQTKSNPNYPKLPEQETEFPLLLRRYTTWGEILITIDELLLFKKDGKYYNEFHNRIDGNIFRTRAKNYLDWRNYLMDELNIKSAEDRFYDDSSLKEIIKNMTHENERLSKTPKIIQIAKTNFTEKEEDIIHRK